MSDHAVSIPQDDTFATRLLRDLREHRGGEADWLGAVLEDLREAGDLQLLAVVSGEGGRWRATALAGTGRTLPYDLLSEVLDSQVARTSDAWCALPLAVERDAKDSRELLVARHEVDMARRTAWLAARGQLLAAALGLWRRHSEHDQRRRWLEEVLEVAADWQKTLELPALLERMAVAATRLLEAERASIFLWDRRRKELVARPALGVEGGELRLPDDTGVVGQVIRSGEPQRVDPDQPDTIDRRVDHSLNYHTRSLVCVPLRDGQGRVIGAFEVLNKVPSQQQPLDRFSVSDEQSLAELARYAALAIHNSRQYAELLQQRNQWAEQAADAVQLIGSCPAMETLRTTIARVADTDLTVLVLGENGTGKEVVSQLVHYKSRRRHERLVAVNCAAIPETLLESELFGHERGAFTDARESRAGKFELANGGTLFLDEIGELSPGGQAKLLRVLEEKVVVRVGGSQPIATDVRIIAATNRDLGELVSQKQFRQDLFFRLTVVALELPPLRDRGDDILALAEFFLVQFARDAGRPVPHFSAAARKRLLAHGWPGNVRELRNLMERLAYLSPHERIEESDLQFITAPDTEADELTRGDLSLADATRTFQTRYIEQQIQRARGNMTQAAEQLGLHRSNLYRKMKQLGMDA